MKVIIAGSRGIEDYSQVKLAIELSQFYVSEVVSGCARGVDKIGEYWAKKHDIPIKRFPANWKSGKMAGLIRNIEMANYADALIAVWDGQSRGTKHMIECAKRKKLDVFVWEVK